MFTELGKVLTHPRCVNCHPAGDRPRQGDARRLHQPPVSRGPDGHGTPTMRCDSCHKSANFDPGRVPGHPEWHLAPREMAWEGKTVAEICAQIKDPARNGGRKVEDLIHHIGKDTLVGWAWSPGYGRSAGAGHAGPGGRAGRGLGEEPGQPVRTDRSPAECQRRHPGRPKSVDSNLLRGDVGGSCRQPSSRLGRRSSLKLGERR